MKRVLCVWFPDWPIQRLCAARPELKRRPVVLFDEAPRGFQIAHCSRNAQGVSAGMPLAEAKALLPHADYEQHDCSADVEALQMLAVRCQQFSPIVGIGEEASLLMDVTGCAHLFGGEPSMIRQVAKFMGKAGLVSRIAIADTIGAAWAVCRHGRAGVVPREATEAMLCELPVTALRLEASIVETLSELEIRTIGELRTLPRGSLTSRFGASVANRLDQVFGERPELIFSIKDTEPIGAAWTFDEPLTDRRSLELALYRLIEHIADELRNRQLGVQRLTCQMNGLSFPLGTTSPTASAAHLWELVRLHLERLSLPNEVTRMEIQATMTAKRVERQQQIVPDERIVDRDLRLLWDRLCSRLGNEALLRPKLVSDALPEFACRLDPILDGDAKDTPTNSVGMFRPLRLLPQPIPVEVVSLVPDGPPIRFRWKNELHSIRQPWGPERIESGWWRGPQVRRDYYRVETTAGERFWLFRTNGAWFLHGVFE